LKPSWQPVRLEQLLNQLAFYPTIAPVLTERDSMDQPFLQSSFAPPYLVDVSGADVEDAQFPVSVVFVLSLCRLTT
jgi:hypothetical protein